MCEKEAYLQWCAKCNEAAEAQYRKEVYDILKVRCMKCGKQFPIMEYMEHNHENISSV